MVAQLAFVMLAMFGQMERIYAAERASRARFVAAASGRRTGRPSVVDPAKLEHAALLLAKGSSIREITAKTGLKRTTSIGICRPGSLRQTVRLDVTQPAGRPARLKDK